MVVGPDTAWDDLSIPLRLAMSAVDLVGDCTANEARTVDHVRRNWDEVAFTAAELGRVEARRLSRSTWIAAAPDAASLHALSNKMRDRAPLYAPILTADDPSGIRYSDYRSWFRHAAALDARSLVAAAFVDVTTAVRDAAAAMRAEGRVVLHSVSGDVDVSRGDGRVVFDAKSLAFMAIMAGMQPEALILAALEESSRRAQRMTELAMRVQGAIGPHDMKYADDVPVFRISNRMIVDPVGARYLTGECLTTGWETGLRVRAAERGSPSCTCHARGRVQGVLRRASDLATDAFVGTLVGSDHILAYESRCPHVAQRLLPAEPGSAECDSARCLDAWSAHPVEGEMRIDRTERLGYRAIRIHGAEAGSLSAVPDLRNAVCRAVGFEVDATVSVYAPTANVLVLTDEPFELVHDLVRRRSFRLGILDPLANDGLTLGARVGYLASIVVGDDTPDSPLREQVLGLDSEQAISPPHPLHTPLTQNYGRRRVQHR